MKFEAVFSDTGCERPETYAYIGSLKMQGFEITTIVPELGGFNNLYDYCWHYRMVPARHPAWCSVRFKREPCLSYYEKPCWQFIAFDYGEKHRAQISSADEVETRWPLIEREIDRQGCVDIIKAHDLPVPVKSGCYMCPQQTYSQWRELRRVYPELFCKAVELEKRNIEYRKSKGKKPMYLDSNGKPLDVIVNEAQGVLFEELKPPCYCMT